MKIPRFLLLIAIVLTSALGAPAQTGTNGSIPPDYPSWNHPMGCSNVLADSPPAWSPDFNNRYKVSMRLTHPEKSANDPDNSFLIVLTDTINGREIASVETIGYVVGVFCSEDGKYVAINNRRANAGDYLWVFELPSGRCIKAPEDIGDKKLDFLLDKAIAAFHQIDSNATKEHLQKYWIQAGGFAASPPTNIDQADPHRPIAPSILTVGVIFGPFIGTYTGSPLVDDKYSYEAKIRVDGKRFTFLSGQIISLRPASQTQASLREISDAAWIAAWNYPSHPPRPSFPARAREGNSLHHNLGLVFLMKRSVAAKGAHVAAE